MPGRVKYYPNILLWWLVFGTGPYSPVNGHIEILDGDVKVQHHLPLAPNLRPTDGA